MRPETSVRMLDQGPKVCAADIPDAQAAWEMQMSLWATMTGGADMVMHAAGWMEGGFASVYSKTLSSKDAFPPAAVVSMHKWRSVMTWAVSGYSVISGMIGPCIYARALA